MSRRLTTLGLVLASVSLLAGVPVRTVAASNGPIEHVVVIIEQNHTFDAYFTGYPGTDAASADVVLDDGSGRLVGRQGTAVEVQVEPGDEALDNGLGAAADAYAEGAMDGFARAQVERGSSPELAMSYLGEDRETLWEIASRSVLFDRYFSSFRGGSLPNTMTLFAGETYGLEASAKTSLERLRTEYLPTVLDDAAAAGLAAKLYVGGLDRIDSEGVVTGAYDAVEVRTPSALYWMPPLAMPRFWDEAATPASIADQRAFFTDAAESTLPDVSYVLPSPTDHPLTHPRDSHSRLVALINAVMKSPQWSSTAVFVVWDDWGGFYDHVQPPGDLGFRVPALLLSAWAREGYVSHATYDHASIPLFIEATFSLENFEGGPVPFGEAFALDGAPRAAELFDIAPLPPSPVGTPAEIGATRLAYVASLALLAAILTASYRLRHRLG